MTDRPSALIAGAAVLLLTVAALAQQPADTPDPQAAAAAQQVLAIFQAKCASCHDAGQGAAEGGLDYVMDLARLAGNRDLVVPFQVDRSELWFIVDFDDMPPPGSGIDPLTDAQKQAVARWIELGAVAAAWSRPTQADAIDPADQMPSSSRDRLERGRGDGRDRADRGDRGDRGGPGWLRWVGKLHPASVHLPIGMVWAAVLGELLFMVTGRRSLRAVVSFSLWLGAAGAVAAMVLGWWHAESGVFVGQRAAVLQWHRWLGVFVTAWLVVAGLFDLTRQRWPHAGWAVWMLRATLLIAAAAMAATGFLGGGLTHGLNHYRW